MKSLSKLGAPGWRKVVVLALMAAVLAACGNGEDAVEPVRPAMVERPQPAGAGFEAFPGDVKARYEPVLAFRVGGKIAKRHVDAGARVKRGDLLAELDPEDLRLQVAAVRAQLAAAEANLATARAERDRYRNMLERKLVSQSLFDAQQNAFLAAEAQVGTVRAQLDVSRNQAEYAQLRAPADGVIATRQAEAGQVVAAGQPIFTLAEDGEREIAISLPEQGIRNFSVGQLVLVELWSGSGARVPGTIRELSPAADATTRTYAARVSFDAEASGAELGQSARVYAGQASEATVSVPLAAVTGENDAPHVFVVEPASAKVRRTPVVLGPYGESRVPVISGIGAQDWVVVAGVHLLRDGQVVRPVDRENRAVALRLASQP
jgi:multidrug efflux system membrane fusion protein